MWVEMTWRHAQAWVAELSVCLDSCWNDVFCEVFDTFWYECLLHSMQNFSAVSIAACILLLLLTRSPSPPGLILDSHWLHASDFFLDMFMVNLVKRSYVPFLKLKALGTLAAVVWLLSFSWTELTLGQSYNNNNNSVTWINWLLFDPQMKFDLAGPCAIAVILSFLKISPGPKPYQQFFDAAHCVGSGIPMCITCCFSKKKKTTPTHRWCWRILLFWATKPSLCRFETPTIDHMSLLMNTTERSQCIICSLNMKLIALFLLSLAFGQTNSENINMEFSDETPLDKKLLLLEEKQQIVNTEQNLLIEEQNRVIVELIERIDSLQDVVDSMQVQSANRFIVSYPNANGSIAAHISKRTMRKHHS